MTATMPRAETDPAYTAGGATDAELAAEVAALEAADALKQDAATAATDDELAQLSKSKYGQAGMYVPDVPGSYAANAALTAGLTYYARFIAERDMTVAQMAFYVGAAGGSNAVSVGIMAGTGERLTTSGAVTPGTNSTGPKTIDVPDLVLSRGSIYYSALSINTPMVGGAPGVICSFASAPDLFGTSIGLREIFFSSSHPIPATMVGVVGPTTAAPYMALKES